MNNEETVKALQEEVDSLKATLAEIEAMPISEDADDDDDEADSIELDGFVDPEDDEDDEETDEEDGELDN